MMAALVVLFLLAAWGWATAWHILDETLAAERDAETARRQVEVLSQCIRELRETNRALIKERSR